MARTLETGTTVAHYKILSALAAGGMGEVYMAQDTRLDRAVALKVLPAHMVRNEERVRRFIQEAKSASSLNHPHIVTIYEIGRAVPVPEGQEWGEGQRGLGGQAGEPAAAQDAGFAGPPASRTAAPGAATVGAEGAPSASSSATPVHYIAMELVSGDTLSTKIHKKKTDLKTLLRSLAQAAEGLAKAHAAGIVHRDLKPQNIMVSDDGYAKILDFGLAKLTERVAAEDGATSAPTMTTGDTKEGAVMGTIGYMSPEQALGRGTDHRSDIFSFGCILYEAATGRRAFLEDSDVDTLHRIIHEEPTPVQEISPEVPAELRRLVRRCLAKSAERRVQSAKDLAIELADIAEEYDELSASAASGSSQGSLQGSRTSGSASGWTAPDRTGLMVKVGVPVALLIGVVGIIAAFVALRRPGPAPGEEPAFQTMKIAPITSSGRVDEAAISPDGNYLAHAIEEGDTFALLVRQIATGSEVRIVEKLQNPVRGITFSRDGNFVYYVNQESAGPGYSSLFKAPTLGGAIQKILFDIDAAPAFSPDGTRIAFPRGFPLRREAELIVAGADGTNERVLATRKDPNDFDLEKPSWSPDGSSIAAIAPVGPGGEAILRVDVETGAQERNGERLWEDIAGIEWLPDGSGIVLVGQRDPGERPQIWLVSHPEGRLSRISNDLNSYERISLTASGNRLMTIQRGGHANLWVAPEGSAASARQETFATRPDDSIWSVAAAPGGNAIISRSSEGLSHLWRMGEDGGNTVRLTPPSRIGYQQTVARDGSFIAFASVGQDGTPHIWRMALDGSNARQVTSQDGEIFPSISTDGKWILYYRFAAGQTWRVPASGGEPALFYTDGRFGSRYSPDGTRIARGSYVTTGERVSRRIEIIRAEGGDPIVTMEWPDGEGLQWAPDGEALTWMRRAGGADNIWRYPLDGSEPRKITDFTGGRITSYEWSFDGRGLLLTRGEFTDDAVLISDFR